MRRALTHPEGKEAGSSPAPGWLPLLGRTAALVLPFALVGGLSVAIVFVVRARIEREEVARDEQASVALVGRTIEAELAVVRGDAAALAGLVFGLLYLRSGRIGDAVLSHAAAKTVIAGAALLEGDWSLI